MMISEIVMGAILPRAARRRQRAPRMRSALAPRAGWALRSVLETSGTAPLGHSCLAGLGADAAVLLGHRGGGPVRRPARGAMVL